MNNNKPNWSTISSISAFLIGVILLWSFGKDRLQLEFTLVLLAGLAGVAFGVIVVRVWDLHRHSGDDRE